MMQAYTPDGWCGARSNGMASGREIALKVLGQQAGDPHSGLIAFSYLWRRFGPPINGSDEHKDLCAYELTTIDEMVHVYIAPSGSALAYKIGFMAHPDLEAKWSEQPPPRGRCGRIECALERALEELLRPVYVRDVAINIMGRTGDSEVPAERSPLAGLGIAHEPLAELAATTEAR